MFTTGHRLPLEPFVVRMICRSKGMWGSEVIDPISLDKFTFGVGTMILPCGHSMMAASVDALFDGAADTDLKPCPMCRLPVSKGAFAVITEKDAPAKDNSWDDKAEDINTLASTLATPPAPERTWKPNTLHISGSDGVSTSGADGSSSAPFENPFPTALLEGMWL